MNLFVFFIALCLVLSAIHGYEVDFDSRAITINGTRQLLISGSIHYPRASSAEWPHIISEAKANGINIVETYVFWSIHEPTTPGVYYFPDDGSRDDIVEFLSECKRQNMFVNLRFGPYTCAEWNFGGFPAWLKSVPNITLRTMNDQYLEAMESFVSATMKVVDDAKLFAKDGGPIIMAQIENEYGNMEKYYGDDGAKYVEWSANLADSYDVKIPWIMCQQGEGTGSAPPAHIINTCNGYYCDQWIESHEADFPNQPHFFTENWPGWFQNWGNPTPHRPATDVAFSVARWFAKGGSLMNYYMAFGGTTFGRQVGGPLIITSYDYDVQINEYGLRAEPKFSLTAKLHNILMDASNILLSENSLPLPKPVPLPGSNSCETHTYYCAKCNQCIQFLSNYGVSNECSFPSDAGVDTHAFAVPAWSVSILRGDYMRGQCLNTEELINTKTSTVSDPDIKASNYQVPQLVEGIDFTFQKNLHDPVPYEMREDDPRKKTQIVKNAPVEQLTLTEDKTDYLWYSVNIPPVDTGLRGSISFVTGIGGGSVGYVYANGVFVGSTLTQNGHSPVLSMLPIENMTTIEATVTSIIGVELPLSCRIKCQIDVLSMNMGIKNYGPYLELVKTGIISAITWKSEFSEWVELSPVTHTVGLLGESGRNIGIIADMGDDTLRENAPLQWYSMSFPSPPHLNVTSDNYALELVSPDTGSNSHVMGKGAVWVNGMMLGRYWDAIGSTAIADCDDTCVANQVNWVGAYSPERCTSGCTIPSQTQYKLPTSLLNTDGNDNILILFEEIGGSPSKIKLNEIVMKEY